MTPSSWILILVLSNNAIFDYQYRDIARCETAGRYALSLAPAHKQIRPIDFYCIPGGFSTVEKFDANKR